MRAVEEAGRQQMWPAADCADTQRATAAGGPTGASGRHPENATHEPETSRPDCYSSRCGAVLMRWYE